MWLVIKKCNEITVKCTLVSCLKTNLLQRNERYFALHNKFSNIPPSTSVRITPCLKIACFSPKLIFTLLYANSSIENAREQFVSSVYLPFLNLVLHPTPTNKNLTELGLGCKQLYLDNHSELDTHSYGLLFLTMSEIISTPNYWPFLLNYLVYRAQVWAG